MPLLVSGSGLSWPTPIVATPAPSPLPRHRPSLVIIPFLSPILYFNSLSFLSSFSHFLFSLYSPSLSLLLPFYHRRVSSLTKDWKDWEGREMNGSPVVNAPLNFDRAQLEIGLLRPLPPSPKYRVSRVFDNCANGTRYPLLSVVRALHEVQREFFSWKWTRLRTDWSLGKKNSCNTIFVHAVLRIFWKCNFTFFVSFLAGFDYPKA